jgi:hypothetical protein
VKTFSEKELLFRKTISSNISTSLSFVDGLKKKNKYNETTTHSNHSEVKYLVDFFNHFTDYEYSFRFDQVAEKIHSGADSYFFINFQHPYPSFSTFQNASNQPLSFLLNYALYEYNVRYQSFSFFHIKLDQIANKTFNRESEHDYLNRIDDDGISFVRDLCLKQQYILHHLSELDVCKIRLRGDSCIASIDGVSFQLAWYFSVERLVFTLSFTISNIFINDYEVDNLSEFLVILNTEIKKNNIKMIFSNEQSYFLFQYLSCHIHSIHLAEFVKFQRFVHKQTGISIDDQEKYFINHFDNLLNTSFYLGDYQFIILPPSSFSDEPSQFFFSNGNSIQLI